MKLKVPAYITSLKPYEAGKPIDELEREYGISNSIKLASNENPLGPSPLAMRAIQTALANLHRYPDSSGYKLIKALADKLHFAPENIIIGNGSDDIIGMLTSSFLQPGDEAIMPQPSFLMYEIATSSAGATPIFVPLEDLSIDLEEMQRKITSKTRMVFLTSPHNPTGAVITHTQFEDFFRFLPENIITVLDEAYIDFADPKDRLNASEFLHDDAPLMILRTFSKTYGLAGLRVGYGIGPAFMVELLNRVRQPFNVSSLAQVGALAALQDEAYLERTLKIVKEGLVYLQDELRKAGIKFFPTQANFFLIDVAQDADEIFQKMLYEGVIIRSMRAYGYPEYIRVNVGLPEENQRLIEALKKVLG